MLDTVRFIGYFSLDQLNRKYFRKAAVGPASIPFADLENYVCKHFLQDGHLGTLRISHDGQEPRNSVKRIKTKDGLKEISAIEGGETYMEFSVSKLLWRTNLYEIGLSGLPFLESFLGKLIGSFFYGVKLGDFHITRLDVSYNFDASKVMVGEVAKEACLAGLVRMDFDRRSGTNYNSSHDKKTQTVLWETRDKKARFMFYNKVAEVKKDLKKLRHREKVSGGEMLSKSIRFIEEAMVDLPGLVRCERKVAASKDLKRYGIRVLSDITVVLVKEMIMDSLNRLEVPMAEISEPDEVMVALVALKGKLSLEEISKWYFVFQLRRRVSESDENFVERYGKELGFSGRTYRNYKRLFKEAGVNVKNLGEMTLKGVKEELQKRCEAWEKYSVSLNGQSVDVKPVKVEDLIKMCEVE
jgi:hypothetical protein